MHFFSHQATKPRRIMLSFSFIPPSLRGFVSLCEFDKRHHQT